MVQPCLLITDDDTVAKVERSVSLSTLEMKPQVRVLNGQKTEKYMSMVAISEGPAESNVLMLTPEELRKECAFICFSSGTTGAVKGVVLTHHNIIASALC